MWFALARQLPQAMQKLWPKNRGRAVWMCQQPARSWMDLFSPTFTSSASSLHLCILRYATNRVEQSISLLSMYRCSLCCRNVILFFLFCCLPRLTLTQIIPAAQRSAGLTRVHHVEWYPAIGEFKETCLQGWALIIFLKHRCRHTAVHIRRKVSIQPTKTWKNTCS